jgi:hypothetical protein
MAMLVASIRPISPVVRGPGRIRCSANSAPGRGAEHDGRRGGGQPMAPQPAGAVPDPVPPAGSVPPPHQGVVGVAALRTHAGQWS